MLGIAVFVILLSIFVLTPTPIRAYSRLLPHNPAHADPQILTGELQKPKKPITYFNCRAGVVCY